MFDETQAQGFSIRETMQIMANGASQTVTRIFRNNQVLIADLPIQNFAELHYLAALAYVLADELIPQYRGFNILQASQVAGLDINKFIKYLGSCGMSKHDRSKSNFFANGKILSIKQPHKPELKVGAAHDYVIQDLVKETFMLQALYTDWLLQQGPTNLDEIDLSESFQATSPDFVQSVQFRSLLTPDNYHLVSLLDFVTSCGTFDNALRQLINTQTITSTCDQATTAEVQAMYQVAYDKLACKALTDLILMQPSTNLTNALANRDIQYFSSLLKKRMYMVSNLIKGVEREQMGEYGVRESLKSLTRDHPEPLHKLQEACASGLQKADSDSRQKLLQRVDIIMQGLLDSIG